MNENAREIIQRYGRIYTERVLSAVMEAGFDLKAILQAQKRDYLERAMKGGIPTASISNSVLCSSPIQ